MLTEQMALELDTTPDPRGAVWLAFTRDHNEDDAAATFQRRYGQLPRYIFDGLGGLLLVGPVPEPVDALPDSQLLRDWRAAGERVEGGA